MTHANREAVAWAKEKVADGKLDDNRDYDLERFLKAYLALEGERDELRKALEELALAADPHTNMSDIPVLDALSVARRVLNA
jgi:hypothetical protein